MFDDRLQTAGTMSTKNVQNFVTTYIPYNFSSPHGVQPPRPTGMVPWQPPSRRELNVKLHATVTMPRHHSQVVGGPQQSLGSNAKAKYMQCTTCVAVMKNLVANQTQHHNNTSVQIQTINNGHGCSITLLPLLWNVNLDFKLHAQGILLNCLL